MTVCRFKTLSLDVFTFFILLAILGFALPIEVSAGRIKKPAGQKSNKFFPKVEGVPTSLQFRATFRDYLVDCFREAAKVLGDPFEKGGNMERMARDYASLEAGLLGCEATATLLENARAIKTDPRQPSTMNLLSGLARTWILIHQREEFGDSPKLLYGILAHPRFDDLPPYLKYRVSLAIRNEAKPSWLPNDDELPKGYYRGDYLNQAVLSDRPGWPLTRMLVRRIFESQMQKLLRDDDFKKLHKLAARGEKDSQKWLVMLMDGFEEIDRAWDARGGDLAYKVTSGGWKGFAEHLATARKRLGEALALRPDLPEASTLMITVSMGAPEEEGETVKWFGKTVGAEIDFYHAYETLLWALRPRWGGSLDEIMEFGEACLATGRFDSCAPFGYLDAIVNVLEEIDQADWLVPFRQNGVPEKIGKLFDGILADPVWKEKKGQFLFEKATCLAWCGRFDEAGKVTAMVPRTLSPYEFIWGRRRIWLPRHPDLTAGMIDGETSLRDLTSRIKALISKDKKEEAVLEFRKKCSICKPGTPAWKYITHLLKHAFRRDGVNLDGWKDNWNGRMPENWKDRWVNFEVPTPENMVRFKWFSVVHNAITSGDIKQAKELVKLGMSPNELDENGLTPVICALQAGHEDLVGWFLANGGEITPDQATEALIVLAGGHDTNLNLAKLLISKGADVNSKTHQLQSMEWALPPLVAAAKVDNFRMAELLIENGASIECTDESHPTTPLIYAIRSNSQATARLLVEKGADVCPEPNPRSGSDQPLYIAVHCSSPSLVTLLLEKGAGAKLSPETIEWLELNAPSPEMRFALRSWFSKTSPSPAAASPDITLLSEKLFAAIFDSNHGEMKRLIAAGADLKIHCRDLQITPLGVAATHSDDLKTVDLLVDLGADVNWPCTRDDASVLHILARTPKRLFMIKHLLERGADPFKRDGSLVTPLHEADAEASKLFLEAGADPNAADRRGFTPLHNAVKRRNLGKVKILMDSGANPEAKASDGSTPLTLSVAIKSPDIFLYLCDRMKIKVDRGNLGFLLAQVSRWTPVSLIDELAAKGADFSPDEKGTIPGLSSAIGCGNENLVLKLYEVGLKGCKETGKLKLPVRSAILNNNLALAESFLKTSGNMGDWDHSIDTSCITNSKMDNCERLEFMINHGADPNMPDNSGSLPLVEATQIQNPRIVWLLLNAGADPDLKDSHGRTASTLAKGTPVEDDFVVAATVRKWGSNPLPARSTEKREYRDMKQLSKEEKQFLSDIEAYRPDPRVNQTKDTNRIFKAIEEGIDLKILSYQRLTPLKIAICTRATNVIIKLLEAGADINEVNPDNPRDSDPLALAIRKINPHAVRLLVALGGQLQDKNFSGNTTLAHMAVRMGSKSIFKLLMREGFDPNAQDKMGNNPLRYAVLYPESGLAELLVAAGADLNHANILGLSAMHYAAVTRDNNFFKKLEKFGGNPELKSKSGVTPAKLMSSDSYSIYGTSDYSMQQDLEGLRTSLN